MKIKILVIDDDPNQLFSLELSLKSKGYEVMTAASGRESLTQLKAHASVIDVVLCDYSMPDMNGFAVLDHIRQRYVHVPTILMTAYGSKELVLDAIRKGCAGFIEKPFTLEQLLSELDRVLGLRQLYADGGLASGPMHP
jgi:two-component system NtrC family response regulator